MVMIQKVNIKLKKKVYVVTFRSFPADITASTANNLVSVRKPRETVQISPQPQLGNSLRTDVSLTLYLFF